MSRAPARFADTTRARQAAEAFDVRQLPADYYANPYPYYHALREHSPCIGCPTAAIFSPATRTA